MKYMRHNSTNTTWVTRKCLIRPPRPEHPKRSRPSSRRSFQCSDCRMRGKVFHRRLYAAARQRHARQIEAHFAACQCGEQSQVVTVAEVADAEHAAREFTEPRSEGEIEALVNQAPQTVSIRAWRRQHAGE